MIAVFCAVAGVQPQSETVWRQAVKYQVPRIAFVNKMDRTGANYDNVVNMIRDNLSANPIIVNYPIGAEADFTGYVDLIKNKAFYFGGDKGEDVTEGDIPADIADKIESLRAELMEFVAEASEELLNHYLENGELDEAQMIQGLRRRTLDGEVIPVFVDQHLRIRVFSHCLMPLLTYCHLQSMLVMLRLHLKELKKRNN